MPSSVPSLPPGSTSGGVKGMIAPAGASTFGQRIQGWDVIRGVGMTFVLFTHALDTAGYVGHEGMGIVGLTSFFVLSGYLITGILHRDLVRFGRIRYGRFYWNRAVRLIPALLVVLIAYAVLESTIDRTTDPVWLSLLIGVGYVANLPWLRELAGTLRHLWSLAFEEQFYFLWPAALAFFTWKRQGVRFTQVALGASVVILLLTAFLFQSSPSRLYTLPTTWASPVLIGCLAYLTRERCKSLIAPNSKRGLPLLLLSATTLIACALTFDHSVLMMYFAGPTVAGAASLVLVMWAENWRQVRFWPAIPFVWLGTVSYATYLWNYPVTMYLHEFITSAPLTIGLSVSVSIALASVSWYAIEKPSQRLKGLVRFRQPRTPPPKVSALLNDTPATIEVPAQLSLPRTEETGTRADQPQEVRTPTHGGTPR